METTINNISVIISINLFLNRTLNNYGLGNLKNERFKMLYKNIFPWKLPSREITVIYNLSRVRLVFSCSSSSPFATTNQYFALKSKSIDSSVVCRKFGAVISSKLQRRKMADVSRGRSINIRAFGQGFISASLSRKVLDKDYKPPVSYAGPVAN